MEKYSNRQDAGQKLAPFLKTYAKDANVIVLGLPRGGVPVAFAVARFLNAPLDVFLVRKLGAPQNEELAMGALASGGTVVFNEEVIRNFNISQKAIESVMQAETAELKRREAQYRGNTPYPELNHKTIILVDDGVATGATMRVALLALRKHHPGKIIVAVPVASLDACAIIEKIADALVCPLKSAHFYAVGQWYDDFSQTSDDEVSELLNQARSAKGKST